MEFNRLISLVLGFIVLILAFVWLNNKFRSNPDQTTTSNKESVVTITITPFQADTKTKIEKGPLSFLFGLNNKTPTPSPSLGQINDTKNNNLKANTIEDANQSQDETSAGNPNVMVRVLEKQNNQPTTTKQLSASYSQNSYQTTATQIPQTGAVSILIPSALFSLFGGAILRKKA